MLDVTNADWPVTRYGGSEKKRTLRLDGKTYMVKFPEHPKAKKYNISYINSQFSEYVGCHIFSLVGIPAQNTFLAKYYDSQSNREKVVVACEDFTQDGSHLLECSKLGIHETGSDRDYSVTIEDVKEIISRINVPMDKMEVERRFWDMFVVDAYIGNKDRHLDNWGLLERPNGTIELAPVYDCGSSLSPLYSDKDKDDLLNDPNALKMAEYNLCSIYKMNGEKIVYHSIMKNPPEDLHYAILRMVPQINLQVDAIRNLIDNTEGMSPISKDYMKASLELRREKILQPAYDKADKRERESGYTR